MRRLRSTDSAQLHRKAARYHIARCRTVQGPLYQKLAEEMQAQYTALVRAVRAVEDAQDDATDASAQADGAELTLENGVRDLDAAAAKADRQNPAHGAQLAIFPNGFGEIIDPESEAQLTTLPDLYGRTKPFLQEPGIAAAHEQIQSQEQEFRAALAAEAQGETRVATLEADELQARRQIREQLESAYGRLREFYKARPQLAERFFLRTIGIRRRAEPDPTPPTSTPNPGSTT